jgi:glycosyltransferase involved in cell wall biosynthesis
VKKVLIVAYHFPPQAESSGYLRALKFCRYLPDFGWHPRVLTVHPRAYERTSPSQLGEIPASVHVDRVFALDMQRHLSFRGRYLRALALPDRWASWCLGAIPSGLRSIRRGNFDVILSTFPIATAAYIGWALHRITGKPWVADFRDSMTEPDYPRDPQTWRAYRWIEEKVVRDAARLVFTAQSAVRMYLDRYPNLSPDRCSLILNGYDEEDFRDLCAAPQTPSRPLRFVHMGLLYPIERDPKPFFRAISQLQKDGKIDALRVRIELRASGSEPLYREIIRAEGIDNLVHLLPPLPYRDALRDLALADGLLVFQAACCDHQIPAKVFEYLRLAKPILALTSHTGDTAVLLQKTGGATIVDLADWKAIYARLPEFIQAVETQRHPQPEFARVEHFSRRAQAEQLAHTLDQVVAPTTNRDEATHEPTVPTRNASENVGRWRGSSH